MQIPWVLKRLVLPLPTSTVHLLSLLKLHQPCNPPEKTEYRDSNISTSLTWPSSEHQLFAYRLYFSPYSQIKSRLGYSVVHDYANGSLVPARSLSHRQETQRELAKERLQNFCRIWKLKLDSLASFNLK